MKNILILGIFVLLFSVIVDNVYAKNVSDIKQAKSNYVLPYPGMLPDSPLYKIKVLRDKVTAYLISDPQKKAEFYLLQTDKQMGMILPLINKKNIPLAKQ